MRRVVDSRNPDKCVLLKDSSFQYFYINFQFFIELIDSHYCP